MSLRSARPPILLTGWGHSRFGKLAEETLEALLVQVATEALHRSGMAASEIDAVFLGPVQLRAAAAQLPVVAGPAGFR